MKQISYYNGEESCHPLGFGIAPCNLSSLKLNIKEKLHQNKITEGIYLENGVIFRFYKNKGGDFSGDLEIKVIAETSREINKATKKHKMPFNRKGIVEYHCD